MKNKDKLNQNHSNIAVTGNWRVRAHVVGGNTAESTITKKKTSTTLVCELTRLKSQQKYLECNQVKLISQNFYDNDVFTTKNTSSYSSSKDDNAIINIINEIEHSKTVLDNELKVFRQQSRKAVNDLCLQIKQIKEDIQQPDRLHSYPIGALREHIISINTQMDRLNAKNVTELQLLQQESENLENDTKLLIK